MTEVQCTNARELCVARQLVAQIIEGDEVLRDNVRRQSDPHRAAVADGAEILDEVESDAEAIAMTIAAAYTNLRLTGELEPA